MYYVLLLTTSISTGKISKSVYEYSDFKSATSAFHKYFGAWIANDDTSHTLCMLLDDNGIVYENKQWTETVEVTEETTETTEETESAE